MEKKSTNIINSLFKKRSHFAFRRDPYGDWRRILIGFIVLLALIISWHMYFFYQVTQGTMFAAPVNTEESADMFNRASFKTVVDYYNAREEKLLDIRLSQTKSIDPSL